MPRTARVGRTVLFTLVALIWTFLSIAGVGFPVADWPLPVLQVVVPIWLGALPLASIVLALLDARALQAASGPGAGDVGRWAVLIGATLLNLFLLAIAFLFGAMLVNGPIAA